MTVTDEGSTVKVLAPSDLSEGYVLDVTADGRTFAVRVPPGGAREGEYFEGIAVASASAFAPPADPELMALSGVPVAAPVADDVVVTTTRTVVQNPDGTQTVTEETAYPDGRITKSVTTVAAGADAGLVAKPVGSPPPAVPIAEDVPTGTWRHGLFECFDACGGGVFWMSFCCSYIAMGQLLQRMKMNACGQPGDYKNTCVIWTAVWAGCCALYGIVISATRGYGIVIYYALGIVSIAALTQVRYFMRQRWSIPADCCEGNGCVSDCCCVYWCSCCSVIQMLRHTHDEKVHPYNFTTPTGLDDSAPEVV